MTNEDINNQLDKFIETVSQWHDEDSSFIRSRHNHEGIQALADTVMSLNITLTTTNRDLIRAEERLEYLSKKIDSIESLLHGNNSLTIRVHMLERQDKDFEKILQEVRDLKSLVSIIKNYPLGLKGMILSVVILVILIAFATDMTLRLYGYEFINNYLIEETK
jgi:DNA repair exonuclease SbcCD ATPase subunit